MKVRVVCTFDLDDRDLAAFQHRMDDSSRSAIREDLIAVLVCYLEDVRGDYLNFAGDEDERSTG